MSSVGEVSDREERPAYVRFERRAIEDPQATLKAGRSVSKDVDYALITPPYSKDLVERKVEKWFENTEQNVRQGRTPASWLDSWKKQYEAWKEGQEMPLDGTPIREWSVISPAQIKNLIAINILTVEDLAAVNDQGMARIGMGANDLKNKAKNWLKAATDHGPLTLQVTQLEADNDRLELTVTDLTEKMKLLMNQLEASKQPVYAAPQVVEVESATITASDIMDEEAEEVIVPYDKAILMPELSLREQYKRKFGYHAHGRMKDATIQAKLEE